MIGSSIVSGFTTTKEHLLRKGLLSPPVICFDDFLVFKAKDLIVIGMSQLVQNNIGMFLPCTSFQ